MSKRILTPYEHNQILQYHKEDLDLNNIGETPVEYLTGHAQFRHLDFLVNRSVLIPRLETEQIVDLVKDFAPRLWQTEKQLSIVDVGTGSGCLGISASLELDRIGFHRQTITLIDRSEEALKIARINTERLLTKNLQPTFTRSNLLDNYHGPKIDLLIANLPYIPTSRIPKLETSVKDFEPIIALDGGPNGTTLINLLLDQIYSFLSSVFLVILEVDHTNKLEDFHLRDDWDVELKKDDFDHTRFLIIKSHNI
ncbi:MAG TPA: HemK family protein methyltransferase [Patescibacteria group bacterium]